MRVEDLGSTFSGVSALPVELIVKIGNLEYDATNGKIPGRVCGLRFRGVSMIRILAGPRSPLFALIKGLRASAEVTAAQEYGCGQGLGLCIWEQSHVFIGWVRTRRDGLGRG